MSQQQEIFNLASQIGLDAMAAVVHETAREKGFWPSKYYELRPNTLGSHDSLTLERVTDEAIGTKLALVHSEVTEILEAIRKSQGEYKVVEEMTDVIIRLLDLYAALKNTGQIDSSLDDVLQLKMNKNTQRPQLHGNRF